MGRVRRALLVVLIVAAAAGSEVGSARPAGATAGGFIDVRGQEFYAPAVVWMRSESLTTGVGGSNRFAPHATVTRAEAATFLWRQQGSPATARPHGFVDVPAGSWYDAAVRWMAAHGHTTGVGGSNRFEPLRPVTRAELSALMWRVAGRPAVSTPHGFVDVPAGSWYDAPVRWMKAKGITTGVGGSNRFDPTGRSTRGQQATFIWRGQGRPAPPNPGDSRDCASFRTQPEAQGWFTLYRPWYGDVAKLDPDGDGIACPKLPGPKAFPTFQPDEYKELVLALEPLPDTIALAVPPSITGHAEADARIRWLAESRGYRLRAVPAVGLTSGAGVPLLPAAAHALGALRADARAHGLPLVPSSGYRSVDLQRSIFLRKLGGWSPSQIASGAADGAIGAVLRFNSIPGYSKHHTARAVDLTDGGSVGRFEGTATEQWLRVYDFHNAKRHGFVPSYPRGASAQGPDPEPWEYVHVGVREIRCAAFYIPMADPTATTACP
jgi:hypothetical protein